MPIKVKQLFLQSGVNRVSQPPKAFMLVQTIPKEQLWHVICNKSTGLVLMLGMLRLSFS